MAPTNLPLPINKSFFSVFFIILICTSVISVYPASAAESSELSSSSLSLLETAKGFIPPTTFCFIDTEPSKYSLVPEAMRAKIREYLRVNEHACGNAIEESTPVVTASANKAPRKLQELPVIRWIEEKISAMWDALWDWVWRQMKERIWESITKR
jgi:hypothetical protein